MGVDSSCILLTGAGGQLGRELLKVLPMHGRVVACLRPGQPGPTGSEFRFVDLAHADEVRDLVREVRPRWIINAAAYTAVDAAENDEAAAAAVNAVAPGILAEEAALAGAAMFHFSTDYVFDGTGTRARQEDDPPAPINAYGRTKLAGEQAVQAAVAAHLIVRTSWLYGAGGMNFVRKMLQLSREREALSVVHDQFGAPTSTRFLAEVAAAVIARAGLDAPAYLAANGGLLHAVCRGGTSWHRFAVEIFQQCEALGLPVAVPRIEAVSSAEFAAAARRPYNSRLSTTRLKSLKIVEIPDWRVELTRVLPALHAEFAAEGV